MKKTSLFKGVRTEYQENMQHDTKQSVDTTLIHDLGSHFRLLDLTETPDVPLPGVLPDSLARLHVTYHACTAAPL